MGDVSSLVFSSKVIVSSSWLDSLLCVSISQYIRLPSILNIYIDIECEQACLEVVGRCDLGLHNPIIQNLLLSSITPIFLPFGLTGHSKELCRWCAFWPQVSKSSSIFVVHFILSLPGGVSTWRLEATFTRSVLSLVR